jgi:hypothetical protein
MIDTSHDQRQRRCPMLGHEVAFSYCRSPGRERPCGRILDCWWEAFDVKKYITEACGPAAIEALQAPPPPKPTTIFELMQQAQRLKDA